MKNGASSSRGWNLKSLRFGAIPAALFGGLLCAGCGSVPRTHYYTLALPSPPSVEETKTTLVLQVERFAASEMFRDDRIVYYTSPTELNFYQYHRWSSDPAAMLSRLAVRYFADLGVFKQVYRYPAPVPAEYTLRGRILDLEEVDYGKEGGVKVPKARLGLKLELVRTEDNRVVWSTRREVQQPIERKGVGGLVDALNLASQGLLRDAGTSIAQVVERESAPAQQESH